MPLQVAGDGRILAPKYDENGAHRGQWKVPIRDISALIHNFQGCDKPCQS